MNRRILVWGLFGIFLFSSPFVANLSIQKTNQTASILINEKNINFTDSPSVSATENWYRKWGRNDRNDTINEMDVYNKTGDVYMIGSNETRNSNDDSQILLVKYNNSGDQQWNKTITGGYGGRNEGNDIVVDQKTGEIYIVGTLYNGTTKMEEILIARYFDNGTQDWNRTWGYDFEKDLGSGIALDNSGNLYVSGSSSISSGIGFAIVLIKFNLATLSYEWNVTWEVIGAISNEAYDVACGLYGDVYVTGYTDDNGDYYPDMVLISFDENGNENWNITFVVNNYWIWGNSVAVDSNDDVYITGMAYRSALDGYMFLKKYSNQSVEKWSRTWSGPLNDGGGEDIYIDANDNVIVAVLCGDSSTNSKLRILGYNPSGNLKFKVEWRNSNLNLDEMIFTTCVSGYGTNHFYIAGRIFNAPYGVDNFILVKNPSVTYVIGGGGGGDDDDDDDDDTEFLILGYELLLVILIIISISFLICFIRKERLKIK